MTDPTPRAANPTAAPLDAPHETTLRVRYEETDRMGVVYHGKYFEYFEVGRTEWLRARGIAYRDLEARGHGLAVVDVSARYRSPARYDDLITVRTRCTAFGRASVEFSYEVLLDGALLAEGTTRLASVGPEGKPRRLPAELTALAGAAKAGEAGAAPGAGPS